MHPETQAKPPDTDLAAQIDRCYRAYETLYTDPELDDTRDTMVGNGDPEFLSSLFESKLAFPNDSVFSPILERMPDLEKVVMLNEYFLRLEAQQTPEQAQRLAQRLAARDALAAQTAHLRHSDESVALFNGLAQGVRPVAGRKPWSAAALVRAYSSTCQRMRHLAWSAPGKNDLARFWLCDFEADPTLPNMAALQQDCTAVAKAMVQTASSLWAKIKAKGKGQAYLSGLNDHISQAVNGLALAHTHLQTEDQQWDEIDRWRAIGHGLLPEALLHVRAAMRVLTALSNTFLPTNSTAARQSAVIGHEMTSLWDALRVDGVPH